MIYLLLAPALICCQAQKMFVAATFKAQINCEVFIEDSQLKGSRGGEAGQGTWSRDLERQGEPSKRLVYFKYHSWLGETVDNETLSDHSTVVSKKLLL